MSTPSVNPPVEGQSKFFSNTTKILRGNTSTIVVVVILMIISIYAIVSVYKRYNDTSLDTKTMLLQPTRVPEGALSVISSDTKLPNNVNGKEYAYSFWMYIDAEQLEQTASNKFILVVSTLE